MRAIIQRVSESSVKVNQEIVGSINNGLLILVGFEDADTEEDLNWMVSKICGLRIFNDENGIMNKSIKEVEGDILLISQFTLHAQTKKGNRPSYIKAAKKEIAIPLYEKSILMFEKELNKKIATGIFGADMKISLINDGPVTIIIDSKNKDF